MTAATEALALWRQEFEEITSRPWPPDVVPLVRDDMRFLGVLLPSILADLAVDAERFGIDSTPVWQVAGNINQLWGSDEFFKAMDGVWIVHMRIEAMESAGKSAADPQPEFLSAEQMRRCFTRNGRAISKSHLQETLMKHLAPEHKRQAEQDGRGTWTFDLAAAIQHMKGTTWQYTPKKP